MTRTRFFQILAGFVGLGAAAKGQDSILKTGGIPPMFCEPSSRCLGWRDAVDRKGVNNQCPVCGTMAEPYKPDTRFCGDYFSGQPQATLGLPGCEPKMSITRCKRCNCAFWQDAE